MIKRFILLFSLLAVFITDSKAQTPDPAHSDNACAANLFCSQSRLNGYANKIQLPDPTKIPYPKPKGFCGTMDGPSWFRFVANSPTLELRFNYLNCGSGTSGFQAAIFSTTNCSDTAAFTIISNCINITGATGSDNLLANGLINGNTYYLMIDGFSGSQCDYNIAVIQGTIKTVSSGDLSAPLAIYGPKDICNLSNSAVYSIPKNAKATGYNFSISINGNPPIGGIQPDSFYKVNAAFTPIGSAIVTANYVNNCFNGPTTTLNVNIGSSTSIDLPPITLNFGQSKMAADSTFAYGAVPLSSDVTDEVYFSRPDNTFSGCDTSFHVTVKRLAKTVGGRAYFLRPGETLTLGGTTYSVSASNCNFILAGSGDTIYNAVQTYVLTPASPNLTCNSVRLRVNKTDSCANVRHFKAYNWYVVNGSGSLSPYGTTNDNVLTSNADSFVVIIRDSVIINGKPESGSKIYTDTLKVRVTGVGSADVPPQPTTITGSPNVCQGSTVTYSLSTSPPEADSIIWSLLRGSGTILSGQGTQSITVRWSGSTIRDTLRVVGKNACFTGASRDLVVNITNFPNFNAGADATICGTATTLNAVSGGGSGNWTNAAGNPSVAAFQNATSANSQVTTTNSGIYRLIWSETKGSCSISDTVAIRFNPVPQVTAGSLRDSCNTSRTQAFARFNVSGGTSPVNVYFGGTNNIAGTITNGQFQSVGFTPGNYTFDVRDVNNCSPATSVQGTQACIACTTNAGSMQAGNLSICEGDSARAIYLGGSTLEPDDTLHFVLHTSDPKTGIIARSKTPIFGFQAGMSYETVYYISAVAGNKTATGADVTDFCYSSSTARLIQVVFHKKPTAVMAVVDSNLCSGNCSVINFTLTGRSPYTVSAKLSDPTTRDTSFNFTNNASSITYCPTKNTAFRLFSIKDANNCVDSVGVNRTVNFTVSQPVNAGKDSTLTVCSGIDTTMILPLLLRGGNLGGTWTETSATPSVGGAFNATLATFRTRNQAAGIYKFRYIVKPLAGSACLPDTAFITVNIQARPKADAGPDAIIDCFNPIIMIGGNTPVGNNITIQWSSLKGNLSGNAPEQEVSQADTYIISATSNGCTSRDSVVVTIDTIAPKAVIKPIKDSLTCLRDTITLDGSASSPSGIVYLWAFNGAPFDANPTTVASFGGTYELGVIKTSNGCISTQTIEVKENRTNPTVFIEQPKKLNCRDTIVSLNALSSSNGAAYTFKWTSQQRGHFKSDSTTLEPKVDSSGLYKLVITDKRNGCSDSTTMRVIREVDVPLANAFVADSLDCYHKTVNLSARGSTLGVGLTYEWIANPGRIVSGETSINAIADEPGMYYFIATNGRTGCAAIDSVAVFRNEKRPESINFTTKKPACYGEQNGSLTISSTVGGTSPYLYSLDGKVYTTRKAFTNLNAGQYKLYVQDASGCVLDSTFNVSQDRQIGVSMGLDTTIKLGDSILLVVGVNTPNVKRVIWSSYTDSLCAKDSACLQQWVRPVRQTTYKVTVRDTAGCKATGSVTVSINKTRPVFMANVFSPNNDGNNDIFMVNGSQVVKIIKRFQVFDRWGERVSDYQNFQPDNPAFGWDGKFNGKDVQSGVYPYFVEVEYLDGAVELIEGSITLMR